MRLGDLFRRRQSDSRTCAACGATISALAVFCSSCGVRVDEPEAQPLYIVDRATGLFNDRFIRPVLEDELARAHRYGRPLRIMLIEPVQEDQAPEPEADEQEETLKVMAGAVAGTPRDRGTPGGPAPPPPAHP